MLSQQPIRIKENIARNQWKLNDNTSDLPEARENACDQGAIDFSFESDWLRKCREFSGPIIQRSKANPQQSRIIFHNKLGIFCDSYTTQNITSVMVSTSAISLMKFGRGKKVVTTYFPLNFLEGIKKELILIISVHFQAEKNSTNWGGYFDFTRYSHSENLKKCPAHCRESFHLDFRGEKVKLFSAHLV